MQTKNILNVILYLKNPYFKDPMRFGIWTF
jgi:hypothetical protein